MIKNLLYPILAIGLYLFGTLDMSAQYRTVVVNLTDNSAVAITMESDMRTLFHDNLFHLQCSKGNIEFDMSTVAGWGFSSATGSNNLWAGLDEVASDTLKISYIGNNVTAYGLPAGSDVAVYAIDGKLILSDKASGDYTLSLSSLAAGVYVVKINSQTLKISVK